MNSITDHYAVLGLRSDATAAEVRAAFRRAARAHHPDSQFSAFASDESMAAVNAAYAVLSDPHRRAQHDLALRAARGGPVACSASRPWPGRTRSWLLAGGALLSLGSAAAAWSLLHPASPAGGLGSPAPLAASMALQRQPDRPAPQPASSLVHDEAPLQLQPSAQLRPPPVLASAAAR